MKKYVLSGLLLILLLSMITLSACGHEHSYGDWTMTVHPRCTADGEQVRTCQCGEQEHRVVPSTGHVEGVWCMVSDPRCTTAGLKEQVCDRCDSVLETRTIEPTGHTAGEWITMAEATTNQVGMKHLLCQFCEAVMEEMEIPVIPSTSLVVILDAGHGGSDPGEIAGNVPEKHINPSFVYKIKALLEKQGITVLLTRTGDEQLSLEERASYANEVQCDLFVSVHCNSYDENPAINGFELFYYQDSKARTLAGRILDAVAAAGQINTRRADVAEFFVLKNTNMPAVLLEMGFMTNEQELANLCTDSYQDWLSEIIASTIAKFLMEYKAN